MRDWKEVNERKSTSRAKLRAASQEKRLHEWKELLENRRRISPEITDKPIHKITNGQLDIKLKQFTEEKLDTVLKK